MPPDNSETLTTRTMLRAAILLLAMLASTALLLPHTTEAAVTFDAVGPNSSGTSCADCDNLQWSHTVSGANTLLVVGVSVGAFDPMDLTVTYNGDPMTSASSRNTGDSTDSFAELFYLVNPDAGAHTIDVQGTDTAETLIGGSISFNGVDQATPVQNATSNAGDSGTASLNVSSAVGNMVVDVIGSGEQINTSSQTNRWLHNINSNTGGSNAAQSTAAGATSVSMGYSTDNEVWAMVGMDVVAAAEAATRSTLLKPPNNLGLVGYWSFNEGTGTIATDFSGNGNHGTLQGEALWGSGRRGAAVVLDGTDDYVQTPSYTPGTTGTISLWFRANSFTDARRFFGTDDDFEMIFSTGSSPAVLTGDLCGSDKIDTNTAFRSGTWYHFVITWNDTTNTLTSYVNGVQDNQTNNSLNCTGLAGNLNIGWRPSAPTDERFSGTMDEVRVYNRVLDSTEVAKLYQSGAVKFTTSSVALQQGSTLANGLVGHWTFDGPDTISNITDRSGHGNHGYFNGGATSSAKVIGKLGQALDLDGADDYVNVGNVGTIHTIAFWMKADDPTTREVINIDGTDHIELNGSAQVTATSFPAATIYVDGSTASAVVDTEWRHVVVTDSTGVSGSTFQVGQVASSFYDGKFDDVRVYNRALTPAEIKQLYRLGHVTIRQ